MKEKKSNEELNQSDIFLSSHLSLSFIFHSYQKKVVVIEKRETQAGSFIRYKLSSYRSEEEG